MKPTPIECPHCHYQFDIQSVLLEQANEEAHKKIEEDKKKLEEAKALFEEKKRQENELFLQRMSAEKIKIETQLRSEQAKQQGDLIQAKDKENEALREQLRNLLTSLESTQNQLHNMDIEKKKWEMAMKEQMLAEAHKKAYEHARLDLQKETLGKIERLELQIKERDLQIESIQKNAEIMQKKAFQGSMQTQGEAQEIALEEFLQNTFPFDLIEEVEKGRKGADVLQRILNTQQQECGTILYESKRTNDFKQDWIDKLKIDQTQKNATLAILVTQTMPKDMPTFGSKDGIWICTFRELKLFIKFIRDSLIREYRQKTQHEDIDDKKQRLYHYLISEKFSLRVQNIVKGFVTLKEDLDKEKRLFTKHWKQREEQIDLVIENTIEMYGSIQGIGGSVLPKIKHLELPEE